MVDRQVVDFVVVGAGSAGCVLANRLSADRAVSVVVLEAGGSDDAPEVRTPALSTAIFGTDADWQYHTEPTAAVMGRSLEWPRGKLLGGTSSINGMIYNRGNRRDYDGWAAMGNRGWSYEEVLPYFRRSEDHEDGSNRHHGVGGPQRVEHLRFVHPISDALVAGFETLGFARNDDFNGIEQDGFGRMPVTQRDGARCSAADGYLRPILGRPNLDVRTGVRAVRVVVEEDRAVGVDCIQDGREQRVLARRGVVMAAGSVATPQLLMCSGVGPQEVLGAVGVEVVHHLPGVGRNLQDQMFVPVTYATTVPTMKHAADKDQRLLYADRRRGMLSSNLTEAGGFVRTLPDQDAPDVELLFGAFGLGGDDEQFSVLCGGLQPRSTGRITLISSDPAAQPRIEAGYLDHDEDVQALVRGIQLARRAVHTQPLDPYRGEEVLPGSALTEVADLETFVRQTAVSFYHQVGTCAMGNGRMAVVDDRLAVHGLRGLWIADASVMPRIVGGHVGIATMMIAEKAADLLMDRPALPPDDATGSPSTLSTSV
jgi:choline dehydrogenase